MLIALDPKHGDNKAAKGTPVSISRIFPTFWRLNFDAHLPGTASFNACMTELVVSFAKKI
jgi:hypothetical protein